jgi:hypothetical protein
MPVAVAAPVALADSPGLSRPDLAKAWARLAGNVAEFRALREQMFRRVLLPRALQIGAQLDALQQQYPRGLRAQDGEGFLADAFHLTGLRKAQIGNYIQIYRRAPVIRAYTERHQIPDPRSLSEAQRLLAAAMAEAKGVEAAELAAAQPHAADTDAAVVEPHEDLHLAEDRLDAAHGRAQVDAAVKQAKDLLPQLWGLSRNPALQHRANLQDHLAQVAEALSLLLPRIDRALADAERPVEVVDQPELVIEVDVAPVAAPMPVVIEHLAEPQGEEVEDTAKTTPIKAAAKGGIVAQRYPYEPESLARLEYDIAQAGGQGYLAEKLGLGYEKRSTIAMRLKGLRRKYA